MQRRDRPRRFPGTVEHEREPVSLYDRVGTIRARAALTVGTMPSGTVSASVVARAAAVRRGSEQTKARMRESAGKRVQHMDSPPAIAATASPDASKASGARDRPIPMRFSASFRMTTASGLRGTERSAGLTPARRRRRNGRRRGGSSWQADATPLDCPRDALGQLLARPHGHDRIPYLQRDPKFARRGESFCCYPFQGKPIPGAHVWWWLPGRAITTSRRCGFCSNGLCT
jgi:hypothetical protein